MLLPEIAEYIGVQTGVSGTWMFDISKSLSETEGIKLAIACVYGNEFQKHTIGRITYYIIPGTSRSMMFYDKSLGRYWQKIESDFSPDIVHIHGTEYSHSLSYINTFPKKKYLLSIQGIIGEISKVHSGELPLSVLIKYRTHEENRNHNGMIERTLLSVKNSVYEKKIIKSVKYATGRTDWDRNYILKVNPAIKYYRCFYNLRTEFYNAEKWNYNKCEKNAIYCSTSAQSPLKGGHVLVKALHLLKNKNIDFTAYFLGNGSDGLFTETSGYSVYINSLIKKYGLQDNIRIIPSLDADGVIEYMQKCNVLVVPSAMENASATLREGFHIGIPSVCSKRGGMTELAAGNNRALLYDYNDYEHLADHIVHIFSDKETALSLSNNSCTYSNIIHNRENNTRDFLNMYRDILNRFSE